MDFNYIAYEMHLGCALIKDLFIKMVLWLTNTIQPLSLRCVLVSQPSSDHLMNFLKMDYY